MTMKICMQYMQRPQVFRDCLCIVVLQKKSFQSTPPPHIFMHVLLKKTKKFKVYQICMHSLQMPFTELFTHFGMHVLGYFHICFCIKEY